MTHTMLYAIGFIGLFLIGGLTGLFLGAMGLTVHLTETYFIVAHFHYVMVGGQLIAFLGGIHFWWSKMTGKMYSEFWGKISAMLVFVGFNLTFFPQFILGYQGMPRRYASYPEEFQVLNIFVDSWSFCLSYRIDFTGSLLNIFTNLGRKSSKESMDAFRTRMENIIAAAYIEF